MPREDRRYPGPTAHASVRAIRASTASSVTRRMSVALHRNGHRLRDHGTFAAPEQAALAQGPDGGKEHRDEEHADQGRHEHPEENPGPDRVPARGTGATRREQGRDAEDERERGQ